MNSKEFIREIRNALSLLREKRSPSPVEEWEIWLADNHYLISKSVDGGRTRTNVKLMDFNERVDEIARTLGGASVTDITRENARQLLLQKNDM